MGAWTERLRLERLLWAGYVLLWLALLFIGVRVGDNSGVLFGWSVQMLLVLVVYGLGVLATTMVVLLRSPIIGIRSVLSAAVVRITRNRLLSSLVVLLPAVFLLSLMAPTRFFPVGAMVSLFHLGFLAALYLIVLSILGRPRKQLIDLTRKFTLAGSAAFTTVIAIELGAVLLAPNSYHTWDLNPKRLDVRFETDDFDVRVLTNRQGLREPSEVKRWHPLTYRIVVIGDSMTFGWGVGYEQCYGQVAQSALREQYDLKNVEFVNMGRPGATPVDYLRYLRLYASKLDPDLVVLGFVVGNDCPVKPPASLGDSDSVERALDQYLGRPGDSSPDRSVTSFQQAPLETASLRRLPQRTGRLGPIFDEPNPLDSTTLEWAIATSADPADARRRLAKLEREGWLDKGLNWRVNPWLIKAIILHPKGAADSLVARPETAAMMRNEWALCAGLLRAVQEEADKLEVPLVILAIPCAHSVSPKWVDFLEQLGCEVNPRMTTSEVINHWMAEFCEKEGIVFIDPLDRFRDRQSAGERLYLRTDDHMTPAGHRLLGNALAEGLAPILKTQ